MTTVAWDGAICQSNWVMTCKMMLCRNIDEVRNTLYQQENGFLLGRARFVNDENGSLGLSEKYVFVQCALQIQDSTKGGIIGLWVMAWGIMNRECVTKNSAADLRWLGELNQESYVSVQLPGHGYSKSQNMKRDKDISSVHGAGVTQSYLWHVGVAGHCSKGYYPFQTALVVIHGSGYEFGAFGKEEISGCIFSRFGMDDKRLPPSTNARRAGISNLVSGNLTPPNLTAPEQQTYAERGNNMLYLQSSLDERLTHQYPGSLDTKGLPHSVPARVYDGATADHDTLQGPPGTIRGDQLQNATSYVQSPGQADYGFGYEVPGREDTWVSYLGGIARAVGGTGNSAESNPAYAGTPGPRENPWGYDSMDTLLPQPIPQIWDRQRRWDGRTNHRAKRRRCNSQLTLLQVLPKKYHHILSNVMYQAVVVDFGGMSI
ncbi:C2H2 zinc finger domain-containing protein [Histoplasma capsulatum G186AR]|uniref:C2H2 zinc finger domain-containing protein n=1 Tax=Ajellomyces capsulatus (strain G186AR / H82 / ATCC MYA-2454 / RMSCC 2432) TaxID=447093 RepID=C0NEH1_AJECG|nr:C2H2 zinc finger domain-containing protein [Histoplasma capsulatum G186AR]EEH09642.1 C2H2 zinc finger domain-containing protein [Histoplasma capsulatum G186AR]